MANWYAGRNAVKQASNTESGRLRNDQIDRAIAAASRMIERKTRREFYPTTKTNLYRWPRKQPGTPSTVLYTDEDLLAVTALLSEAQNASPTTIASSDYFLEPNRDGPPYDRIEIDLSSSAAFASGDTPQRSISVTGRWGYSEDTEPAGTVVSGLDSDAAAVSMVVPNGALIDVGAQLLIETEQVHVTEIIAAAAASGALLDGALTTDMAEVSITVDASHGINVGEVILVDAERMFVEDAGATTLTVTRAYDGTVLAAHLDNAPISVYRTATITRAQNGTTAATHADATAVTRYVPPNDVELLCIAEALADINQERAGWGRTISSGEAAREPSGHGIEKLRATVYGSLKRSRYAAI